MNPLIHNKISRAHIGYYRVNDICYQTKIEALLNCDTGTIPQWEFLEQDLKLVDWRIEPHENLYELYRQRAIQLRETYDRLILMLSGGIDSINVLYTFIDNHIPLDGIVTYGSFSVPRWQYATKNAEQLNITVPLISQLRRVGKLPCEHYLLDDFKFYKNFQDESWVFATGNGQLSPEAYIFNFHWQDDYFQRHLMAGNTAIIRGVDKPKIIIEDGEWKLIFIDATTFGSFPAGIDARSNSYYGTEYFYWTGDFPKILVKQAHMIKRFVEEHVIDHPESRQYWLELFKLGSSHGTNEYAKWIDPLIYGKHLSQKPGQPRNYFSVGKPPNVLAWSKDDVFFQHANSSNQSVWKSGLEFVHDNIDHRFMNQTSDDASTSLDLFIKHGLMALVSARYPFSQCSF